MTLNCIFKEGQTQSRHELFNFKNVEGQAHFKEETTNTIKFTQCFEGRDPFKKQAQKWFRTLNSTFYKCFQKIRSKKRKLEITKVDILLEQRKKLRRLLQYETDNDYRQQILDIEEEVSKITRWQDAEYIWDKFQKVADSDNTSSTQAMWKWKKKLFPKVRPSPPMGIKDNKGKVQTGPKNMKYIYESEFKHRLRDRPLLPET